MAEELTRQQQQAVEDRGGKLLVSAAAGSGKTKVLVDRLLLHLTENKGNVNIDDFLIITYTKAAASELRGKIAAKLNERLAMQPGNRFLQKQLQRLYLTNISTVHAFCSEILRENAYRLDIPGDFRVAEEQECQLLQLQVLDKLLNEAYADSDEDFIRFVDSQELGRDDRVIPQIILQVYQASRCYISPDAWLTECVHNSEVSSLTDASQTVWGKYLMQQLYDALDLHIDALQKCAMLAEQNGTMPKPSQLLQDTVSQLISLRETKSWDAIVNHEPIRYGTLSFPKSATDLELQRRIKAIRNACKKYISKKLEPFADDSATVLSNLQDCAAATRGLVGLVHKFTAEFEKVKRSRRILDFSDLEHKMLDLTMGKKRQGTTALAHEIGDRFYEIMVDEYQDSNAVQDAIFSALTEKKQNCFMVGDVKQSIYQFRLADPGIFLDKYNRYVPADEAKPGEGRKIMLSRNFRSAGSVIDAVNDVFTCCMSPQVGGLYYGDDEKLIEGIPHEEIAEPEVELCALTVREDTYAEEAAYTADRIVSLLDGTHIIRDGQGVRPITADDIVILLRSPGSVGGQFQYALEQRGIRVNSGGGMDLLQTEEVSFLRSILQIIDNPLQDIPLIAALTSRVLCFTADDLAYVRGQGSKRKPLFESLKRGETEKIKQFLNMLTSLRQDAKLYSLSQLIERVVCATRLDSIYAAFSDGDVRMGNLQAFYQIVSQCESANQKELSQFLHYLDSLEEKGLSVAAEQNMTGAVTIMSIHKSKGLEFPVVFLCGLSRDFNREDTRAQVLCNKELGIGLNCVDLSKRIRYPSIAKKSIAAKMISESLSEEMRVLYVAMTRAKDRLIMTYAVKKLADELDSLVGRMDLCDRRLLTATVNCPGTWILLTALQKMEAGAFFSLCGRPEHLMQSKKPWRIFVEEPAEEESYTESDTVAVKKSAPDISRLERSLSFRYPYLQSTILPSKQTATQLKGRLKDLESAENTEPQVIYRKWRSPSFVQEQVSGGVAFGNAVHSVMQYIDFTACHSLDGIVGELNRLTENGLVNRDAVKEVEPQMLWQFFSSEMGRKLCAEKNVLREFKFSILEDASTYVPGVTEDKILLQGVVDCAIVEPDGITVLDFKTDRVTSETVESVAASYALQVKTYARAMEKIFQKRVKSSRLYFFRLQQFVDITE